MSPRAFQTILVPSSGTKDRIEWESKVLAAALKQRSDRGDANGTQLAHSHLSALLKSHKQLDSSQKTQEVGSVVGGESLGKSATATVARNMPDIVWSDEGSESPGDAAPSAPVEVRTDFPAAGSNSHPDIPRLATPSAPAPLSTAPGEQSRDKSGVVFDAYGILGVDQIASFDEIHKYFFMKVRRLLINMKGMKRKDKKPLLKELQAMWIAHDILSDPVTRTDYDFRLLGLRGAPTI